MNNLQQIFGQAFDTSTVEPQGDYDVLPPGKYIVSIDKAEVKQTKAGTGHLIKLTMTVLDGPAKNKKLWDQINIQNPSQQCQQIGLRQLSALGRACDVNVVSSEEQFLGKVCVAHVKVKDDNNEIRTYSKVGADVQQYPSVAPQQQSTQYQQYQQQQQPQQPQQPPQQWPMQPQQPIASPGMKPPWAR